MLYVVRCCAVLRCAMPCCAMVETHCPLPPHPHFRPTLHPDEPPLPIHPTSKIDPYPVHTCHYGLQMKQGAELGKRDGVFFGGGRSDIGGRGQV